MERRVEWKGRTYRVLVDDVEEGAVYRVFMLDLFDRWMPVAPPEAEAVIAESYRGR